MKEATGMISWSKFLGSLEQQQSSRLQLWLYRWKWTDHAAVPAPHHVALRLSDCQWIPGAREKSGSDNHPPINP